MRKLIEVKEGIISNDTIQFTVETAEPFEAVEAAGQMITDSDNRAFIYLLDTGDEFVYVQFNEHTWPMLKDALHRQDVPLLKWGQQVLPLQAFHEELWMLIDNIEGNDNYGESFRAAVEEAFHEALASRS